MPIVVLFPLFCFAQENDAAAKIKQCMNFLCNFTIEEVEQIPDMPDNALKAVTKAIYEAETAAPEEFYLALRGYKTTGFDLDTLSTSIHPGLAYGPLINQIKKDSRH